MTTFEVVTIAPQPTAVVRAEVPADELPSVFDHAFHAAMETLQAQQRQVTGPPFGLYPRAPAETVAVAAGFPVDAPIEPRGDVGPLELPGGRAVQGMHVGSYDGLAATYGELAAWATEQELELDELVWESYLTDPTEEPDPAAWRTLLTWPVRQV